MTSNQKNIAAFFDIDHTILVDNSSLNLFIKRLIETKVLTRFQLMQVFWNTLRYKLGLLSVESILDQVAKTYTGKNEKEVFEDSIEWLKQTLKPLIAQEVHEKIKWHQDNNHVITILSGAVQYVAQTIQEELNISHSLHSTIEVVDGHFTGKFIHPLCYKEGKIFYAEKFVNDHQIDLSQSYFYTDSITDRPMLEKVGHPIAVNPDKKLRKLAQTHQWTIETWTLPQH